jgi:hypothetical protein
MSRAILAVAISLSLLAACDQAPTEPVASTDLAAAKATNPTATWTLAADDLSNGLASDGNGAYVNASCGVSAAINLISGTGDATIQMQSSKCTRRVRLRYVDGASEFLQSFNNLQDLASLTSGTATRRLILNPGNYSNNSRCGRLVFGDNGTVGAGSSPVTVTRVSAGTPTWDVVSDGNAYCEKGDSLIALKPFSFRIVSSAF